MKYEFERNEDDNLALWFNPKNFFAGFEKWSENDETYGLEIEFGQTEDQENPTESQLNAFNYLLENQKSIFENMLTYMDKDKEVWIDVFYLHNGEYESGFPNCKNPRDLHKYFSFDKIRIDKEGEDNLSYIALMGGCEWDMEHGFGAVLHKEKVKEIGSWDTGYSGLSVSLKDKEFSLAKHFGLKPLEEIRARIKKASENIQVKDASLYLDLFQWLIDQKVVYGYRCTEPDLNDKEIVAFILDTTYLDFTSKELEELPESFFLLENISGLTLRDNKFTTFPAVLGQLPKLKRIGLSNNSISAVSANFKFQSLIESLDLSRNKLTNIDLLIENQKELKSLYLDSNNIESFSEAFKTLVSLNDLRMRSNNIEVIPEFIGNLTKLDTLLLDENNLSTFPETLANLNQLRSLWFSENRFTELPEVISKLKSLDTLNANDNEIEILPDWIATLPKLRDVNIRDNKLTSLPKTLNDVKTPFYLYVSGNPITLEELEEIERWINPEIGTDMSYTLNSLRWERKEKEEEKASIIEETILTEEESITGIPQNAETTNSIKLSRVIPIIILTILLILLFKKLFS